MNRVHFIGFLGVAAIIVAIALSFSLDRSERETLKGSDETPPSASETRWAEAPAESKSPDATENTGTSSSDTRADAVAVIKPSFDIVRVNPQGDTVIAGRAAPGASVTVRDGGEPVGSVTADQNGEWVFVPGKPLPPGDRELSLVSRLGDGDPQESEDVVVLAVPERKGLEEKRPLAVLVPRDGMETKKVLQSPTRRDGETQGGLTLDVVDYDQYGNIRLSGRAKAGSDVIVYLDNRPLGQARSTDDGIWELRPDAQVAPGLYTLRIDETREHQVVARLEVPFSRAAPITDFTGEAYIVVQPGNSLWRIARSVLGKGLMYSVIYDANKDQIRDPDLIYPGQVIAVPKTN